MGDDKKTFKLKTLNDKHTCGMVFKNNGVAQQVRDDLAVDISEWQFYRAKTAAMQMIEGTIKEQYARLWDYCAELKRANPGSTVQMKPIIGLDGCFIKGHHKGQLLAAIGVDANNQMYPIAYAIVESETRDSWRWFLELLNVDLQLNNSGHVSWITDKQKGLLDVLRDLFLDSEHRHCVKHLHNNFKVHHKGLFLQQLMWSAAKSTTTQSFRQEMEKMKVDSPSAFEWLAAKDPSHWSRAFLREGAKCDMLCNNMCEAFNSAIVQARDKPIITLLEMVRTYMMKRLTRKRAEIEKWKHPVGPKVYRYVEKIKSLSVYCTPTFSGNNTFQVELVGIPCVHAMAVITTCNMNPYDYVDSYYKKESYIKAYQPVIYGLNGPKMWPTTGNLPVQCPDFTKQRGRPKKSRNLQGDEVKKGGTLKLRKNYYVGRCGICGERGHNKRSCSKRTHHRRPLSHHLTSPLPQRQRRRGLISVAGGPCFVLMLASFWI
ncbi:hypothetical protein UlMin_035462 [Ulmus minor]